MSRAGHEAVTLGRGILVMPSSGRVLGLFPDGRWNAFWVDLQALAAARVAGWANYGGDRAWISPEIDTNLAVTGDGRLEVVVPRSVDPGVYTLTWTTADACELMTRDTVFFRRSGVTADLSRRRFIEQTADVPYALPEMAPGVQAVGYRLTTTLVSPDPLPEDVRPAVWSIVQVPPGTDITIPAGTAAPRTHAFFGEPRFDVSSAGELSCTVRTTASFKLGLHAHDSRGLAIAEGTVGSDCMLVVRAFPVTDPDLCSDVPADDPDATGYVQQIYVDDGGLGGFGELEHHSPFLSERNQFRVIDRCLTYAYSGPIESVHAVKERWITDARSEDA